MRNKITQLVACTIILLIGCSDTKKANVYLTKKLILKMPSYSIDLNNTEVKPVFESLGSVDNIYEIPGGEIYSKYIDDINIALYVDREGNYDQLSLRFKDTIQPELIHFHFTIDNRTRSFKLTDSPESVLEMFSDIIVKTPEGCADESSRGFYQAVYICLAPNIYLSIWNTEKWSPDVSNKLTEFTFVFL